jgi:hypothetical protein
MRRIAAELGAGSGRVGALIEQQDLGEVVTEALAGLIGVAPRALAKFACRSLLL